MSGPYCETDAHTTPRKSRRAHRYPAFPDSLGDSDRLRARSRSVALRNALYPISTSMTVPTYCTRRPDLSHVSCLEIHIPPPPCHRSQRLPTGSHIVARRERDRHRTNQQVAPTRAFFRPTNLISDYITICFVSPPICTCSLHRVLADQQQVFDRYEKLRGLREARASGESVAPKSAVSRLFSK